KEKVSAKHDEDDTPLPKKEAKKSTRAKSKDDDDTASDDDDSSAKKKKVAKSDDDDGGDAEAEADTEVDDAVALSPAGRAVDATLGLSLTGRNLGFSFANNLPKPPPGYKQSLPVAGAQLD